MMTVITHVMLNEGSEPEWDATMRERMTAAESCPGWVAGELLMPLDTLNARVIVGVWDTRADWEAWHTDESFVATAQRLEGLQSAPAETSWHETLIDARRDRA
jgi:heme-degrading monooxygenase HmoA